MKIGWINYIDYHEGRHYIAHANAPPSTTLSRRYFEVLRTSIVCRITIAKYL